MTQYSQYTDLYKIIRVAFLQKNEEHVFNGSFSVTPKSSGIHSTIADDLTLPLKVPKLQ